jgi:hypothetical protein
MYLLKDTKITYKDNIKIEDLKEEIIYIPESGDFYWLVPKKGRNLDGTPAGSVGSSGYRTISFNGYGISAHRLAYFYMTGEWPAEYVDHIDGNPSNNKWDNLRPATAQQNAQNKRRKYNSYTGIKGVVKDFRSDTWHVHMRIDGDVVSRGPFFDYQTACKEYDKLATESRGEWHKPEPPREQRARFKDEDVTKAVEEFIKDKKLINGIYV